MDSSKTEELQEVKFRITVKALKRQEKIIPETIEKKNNGKN